MGKVTFLILILIGSVCSKCYKGHNGLVEGTVTYQNSNMPVKNATVRVIEGYGYNTEGEVAIGNTDDDGHYKIYYNHRIYRTYHQFVLVTKDTLSRQIEIHKNKSKIDVVL